MAGVNFILPTVTDFRRFGRFHLIQDLTIYHDIPSDLLCHIIPNYYIIKNRISKKIINKLKLYCIYLKNQANYEDFVQTLEDQKELLIRRVKDKLLDEILEKNNSTTIVDFEQC